MRIAIFHDLPSGGAKRTLHELTQRLAADHSLDVYSLGGAEESFCDVRRYARHAHSFPFAPSPLFRRPLGRFNQLQRWRDLGRLLGLAKQVAAAIDAGGYDAMLAQPSRWTQAPAVLLHCATPAVYHCHEPPRALYEDDLNSENSGVRRMADRADPLIALYRARARQIDRAATRAARRVLTNSLFSSERIRAIYGVEPGLLYNGVDAERFRPRESSGARRELLSVGALQPSKGFAFVIASVARIPPAQRPPLRIVGNMEVGSERARLMQLAAAADVQLSIDVGVSDDDLARRYAEAALLVYAPHREPFGLAPLEAMACATPVVGVDEGGVRESVVDGVTGRLVPRDAAQFAETISALLGDAAERRRLGSNARDAVCRQWTWATATARLASELQALRGR